MADPITPPDVQDNSAAAVQAASPTPAVATSTVQPSLPASPDGNPIPLAPKSNDPNLTAPPTPAPTPGHGVLASIFQDLAGGKKTVWTQTPNGPVASKVDLKPGEMAQGILAAALTGLASGYSKEARGGGAGAAFGAGFQGVTKANQENEQNAKEQAQKTFQNNQAADELTIRKQQSILMQQEGFKRLQLDDQLYQKGIQDLRRGNFSFGVDVLKNDQEQADRLILQQKSGMIPLTLPDGSQPPPFGTPQEAMTWANNNAKLAVKKGNYYTVPTHDPSNHSWMLMEVPKTWDDLQWLGVETNSDGTPKKDANGDMIPNGDFKVNGKAVAPGGQMTQHQLYESQQNELGLLTKKVDLEDAKMRLENATMNYKKDARINRAMEEYDKADGNPLAIDPATHTFIMSPSARDIVSDTLVKKAALENSVFEAANKRLEDMGNPKPGSADYDTYTQVKNARDAAQTQLNLLQNQALVLNSTPNVADVMADTLRKQFTHPDGFDQKGAEEELDKMHLESGKAQAIRQRLQPTAAASPATQDQLASLLSYAEDNIKKGGSYDDAIRDARNSTTIASPAVKDQLMVGIAKNALSTISPSRTLLLNRATGQTRQAMNGDASVINQPGWEVIGQGTMVPPPASGEASDGKAVK